MGNGVGKLWEIVISPLLSMHVNPWGQPLARNRRLSLQQELTGQDDAVQIVNKETESPFHWPFCGRMAEVWWTEDVGSIRVR